MGRSDHRTSVRETARDRAPIWFARGGRRLAADRFPPGQHARVADHEHRYAPLQRGMHVPVEMNEVRSEVRGALAQPAAGTRDVVPWIVHPFEAIRAVHEADA